MKSKMKTYQVVATKSEEYVIEIRATSHEDAIEKADKLKITQWDKVSGGDDFHIYDSYKLEGKQDEVF